MKAKFFAIAALVLGLASCQKDFAPEVNNGGEVNYRLSISAPELAKTRAALDGKSEFGAVDYYDATGWDKADLRYILEVYDADEYGNATSAEPVKDRQVVVLDKYEPTSFEVRLVQNRNYRFVVFADFVEEDAATDWTDTQKLWGAGLNHKIGATLKDIEVINEAINNESADAYFAGKLVCPTHQSTNEDKIELHRPYAKVRVVATDLYELNTNVEPKAVKVTYNAFNPNTFNAVTGEYAGTYAKKDFSRTYADPEADVYGAGYDAMTTTTVNGVTRYTHKTLFTDYILAGDEQTTISFDMTVFEDEDYKKPIKATSFNTNIPIQRNHLTTIIGDVLTTGVDINVTIDDSFANGTEWNPSDDEFDIAIWDGKSVKEPAYDDATKTYTIYEASELAWLADQVNGVTRATANTFEGKTFELARDIDLGLNKWTPIGATGKFLGTFDGQNHTIYNLFVSEEGKTSAGLFGYCPGATIKNITVLNAEVYGNYKAAVIVADAVCTKIENCHVDGAIVLSTPYEKDDANNVGAIAGYLAADGGTAWVKDCTVKNAKITAYRKVGGIVGAANGASEVTGNYIESSYITADMTAEYKEDKPADADRIIGWKHANVKDENNTYAGQSETVANALAVRVIVMPKADKIADYINNSEESIVMLPDGTYSFTADVEDNKILQASGANVTLDADGHTLNLGNKSNYGLIANMGAEVVVNDANIVSGGGAIAAADGSKVTVNGGSAYIDSGSTSGRYIFYAHGEGTVITVNGGSYSWDPADNQKRAYVYTETGAKVIINDGTFGKASTRSGYTAGILGVGETIIYGGTFGFNPTQWVAPGYTVKKEGANWVVKAPVVAEDAAQLADAIANAAEGSTIVLKDNVNYGTITAGELKNVTINGAEDAVVTFVTDANTVIENVTLNGVDFVYDGSNVNSGVVINAEAKIENLVLDGCTFVGTGAKAGRGIYGQNPAATITLKNCHFKNLGYPVYTMSAGGYASLVVEGCTFEAIKSWAIMPQYNDYLGDLTVNNCVFVNCVGGLVKAGKFTAGHTFTFTNNVITNSAEHPAKNWFTINTADAAKVVENNTKDGAAWTPAAAEGLN